MKVLFVYPNDQGYNKIPLGIASISACLKKAGHETRVFDTTFFEFKKERDDDGREKTLQVAKSDLDKYLNIKKVDVVKEFRQQISLFKPDLIAVSTVEASFDLATNLVKSTKGDIPVIFGGAYPTTSPEEVISYECIDMVCVGEGEDAVVELVDKLRDKKDITGIRNLWIKQGVKIFKNEIRPLKDMNELPCPDWEIFDERHLIRPLAGSLYRAGSYEISRGCPNGCSYCINIFLQELYRGKGKYIRRKTIDRVIKELKYLKDKYNLEMINFVDDNFLLMSASEFADYAKLYKKYINIPFIIQVRAELLNEENVKLLKDTGCVTISIGIESGNKWIREKVINRFMSSEKTIRACKIIRKYGIRFSTNNIIGIPYETREHIFDTIMLNKKIKPDAVTVNFLCPYKGTKLRDLCIKEGFLDKNYKGGALRSTTSLTMPQISSKELKALQKTFFLYVKLPRVFYPLIKLAENNDRVFGLVCKIYKFLIPLEAVRIFLL